MITLSLATAGVILYGSGKAIAAFCLLPVLTVFYISAPPFLKIALPIVAITFPVTLQVFGRDAFSTGTLIIFMSFAWALSKHKLKSTISSDKIFFGLLSLLILIAFAGMVTKTPSGYWGPAVRHYLNFVSSVTLFFTIVHASNIKTIAGDKNEYIDKLINLLLLITVVHVFLSLLIFNYPWIEQHFSIFLSRTQENLGGNIVQGIYIRATTVFTGGEEFGELLVLVFPFALYKLFISTGKLNWFFVGSLLFGVVISGTRSAFILMLLQLLVFIYVLVPAKYNARKIIVTLVSAICFFLMLPVLAEYAPILIDRMHQTLNLLHQNENIIIIVNRSRAWPMAYGVAKDTLSFLGHGPIQAYKLGFQAGNFHNLYISLIFQFGVIGSILFLYFFFFMAKRLIKVAQNLRKGGGAPYLLSITCLLSLFCFLINEIKFEFNRSDSYQQFVWCLFAIFHLTGSINKFIKK